MTRERMNRPMTEMKAIKKEFQRAVKAYRDTLPDVTHFATGLAVRPDYPKAMLTARQAAKRTATIYLGYWPNDKKPMQIIMELKNCLPFLEWCARYSVIIADQIERNSWGGVSLRLYY